MYEGSYCQHRALKPADFKFNSPVLWWPAPLRGLSYSHRVDSMKWHGLEHHPQLSTPPSSLSPPQGTQSHWFPCVVVPACSGGEKKLCSGNHYLGIKCKPKTNNNKSNQHKVGKHCQPSVTLFCLVSCERVWLALFRSDTPGSWLFHGIHINKALPFAR